MATMYCISLPCPNDQQWACHNTVCVVLRSAGCRATFSVNCMECAIACQLVLGIIFYGLMVGYMLCMQLATGSILGIKRKIDASTFRGFILSVMTLLLKADQGFDSVSGASCEGDD